MARWHNSELPEVRSQRADLLGETSDGRLVHVELQSTNHPEMAQRMLDYTAAIRRLFGRFPVQLVLYVGEAPVRMESRLAGAGNTFEYRIVDIRELDGEALLASPSLDDNVIGILARLSDEIVAVRRVLERIAANEASLRSGALTELMTLAGLRRLEGAIRKESERMPILNDIMNHEVFGPLLKQGREEGREEGRQEGERTVLLKLVADRFGPVPSWARERVETLQAAKLERLILKVHKAATIEDLLK